MAVFKTIMCNFFFFFFSFFCCCCWGRDPSGDGVHVSKIYRLFLPSYGQKLVQWVVPVVSDMYLASIEGTPGRCGSPIFYKFYL